MSGNDAVGNSMLYQYPASDHEEELVRFFGGYERIAEDLQSIGRRPDAGATESREDILICFSNRSGSNLLTDGLKRFGDLIESGEYFNYDVVIDFCTRKNITTLSGYYHALKAHVVGTSASVFCSKIGWGQLYFLSKVGFVEKLLPRAKYVLTRRRDVLAQAVSFSIASQTGRWTSEHEGRSSEVGFDLNDISNRLSGILLSNYYFDRYFALTGKPKAEIVYEDLERDFSGQMTALMNWLNMPITKVPELAGVSLKRQRDETNEKFIAEIRAVHSDA